MRTWLVLILVLACLLFVSGSAATQAQGGSGSMATPTSDLPPRPSPRPQTTVTPTALGGSTSPVDRPQKSDHERFVWPESVSEIRLLNMSAGSWIEWQDAQGDWHAVEGWRAADGGDIVWYVSPAHLGTGPYRARDGAGWASASFYLNGDVSLSP